MLKFIPESVYPVPLPKHSIALHPTPMLTLRHKEDLPDRHVAHTKLQLPSPSSLADGFGPTSAEESLLLEKLDLARLPRHIAVIMDGNGRWAKKRHLPRIAGHSAGTQICPHDH